MNESNLIPFNERTKDEQREIARSGGIASGEARRKRRDLREALQSLLDGQTVRYGEQMQGVDALAAAIFDKALEGDVRAFAQIRDTLYGKPTINVQSDVIPDEVYARVAAALNGDCDE